MNWLRNVDPRVMNKAHPEATFWVSISQFSELEDPFLSPTSYVPELPWRVEMVVFEDDKKWVLYGLQCNQGGRYCYALVELRLLCVRPDVEPFTRKFQHIFNPDDNSYGLTHFISWSDVLDADNGFIKNGTITLEVHVNAKAPRGVTSRKHTGYVGLLNAGPVMAMNPPLLALYFTNQLRNAVREMPTESDDPIKSVPLALQKVFHDLLFSDEPVCIFNLIGNLGWQIFPSFVEHNDQELLRILFAELESKMKGTSVEGTIPKLFQGKMMSYIRCKNVHYTSTRRETFYDIQLNVKGKKNIYESFEDFVAKESLDGDNKYDAGKFGLQAAEKRVILSSFPPVLHLHLMRFQYDPVKKSSVKLNDRFEFYEKISLDPYLQRADASDPANYTLHAVCVHSYETPFGYYVAFIDPRGDGKWCKFDNGVVSRCTKWQAIEDNYGGHDDDMNMTVKYGTNAYMLVYIRDSELPRVLQEVEEVRYMDRQYSEKDECTIMTVNVLLEDAFEDHQCSDLFDPERVVYRSLYIAKRATVAELIGFLSDLFERPSGQIRLWPFGYSADETFRPTLLDLDTDLRKTLIDASGKQNPWNMFVEFSPTLSKFDKRVDVLLFFKLYNPKQKKLRYCGHRSVSRGCRFSDLVRLLNERAGFPPDTELILYGKREPNVIEKIAPLEKHHLKNGDVIIFKKEERKELYDLPTCIDYFKDLYQRIEVTFVDICVPKTPVFTMKLSPRITYDDLAKAVALRLGTDPSFLQFFKRQKYKDSPGNRIRCTFDGTLKDMLVQTEATKKLFYHRLSVSLYELENKYRFKCRFVGSKCKAEKELVLHPNKEGTVADLLEKARKFMENDNAKLRLVQIDSDNVEQALKEDTLLSSLTATYRIEELPFDEVEELERNEVKEAEIVDESKEKPAEDLAVLRRQVKELTIANDKLLKIAAMLNDANNDLETEKQKATKLVETLKSRLEESEKENNELKVQNTASLFSGLFNWGNENNGS